MSGNLFLVLTISRRSRELMSVEPYDPSLEFPGPEESGVEETHADEFERPPFHLVVLKSPVLSSKRRVTVISSYSEVSIGRDKAPDATSPRLRLKEMAVSKYHAIMYWDSERGAYGLVDVGSVHGTFIQGRGNGHEERLSPSKVASHPRYLHHLDVIRIGATLLACHLHESEETFCEECNVTPANELHLIADTRSVSAASSRTNLVPTTSSIPPKDARSSLAGLKRQLLSRHQYHSSRDSSPGAYVDRAAARREQLGTSQPPTILAPPPPVTATRIRPQRPLQEPIIAPDIASTSTPPEPIPVSNIGHRLLAKQGWTPGSGLGVDQSGRSEPITTKSSTNRAGIGIETPQNSR